MINILKTFRLQQQDKKYQGEHRRDFIESSLKNLYFIPRRQNDLITELSQTRSVLRPYHDSGQRRTMKTE